MNLYNTLAYAAICSTLLPLILLLVKFKALTLRLKLLGLLLLISFVTDVICLYLAKHFQNTHPLFHFYTVIEDILLGTYYYLSFNSKKKRSAVLFLFILCLCASCINAIIDSGLQNIDTLASASKSVVLVFCSILLFIEFMHQIDTNLSFNASAYWLNCGFFLYGALPLFCYVFYFSVMNSVELSFKAWAIYLITDILYHLILSIGIWKHKTISQV